MEDLEAEPAGAPPDSAPVESSAPASAPPETPSTPLEDLYDFGPPGEDTPSVPAAAGDLPTSPVAATPDTPVAPVAPVISPELTQRATSLGFSPEVLATFKDPIQLEAVVGTAERTAMQAMQFARNQQVQPVQPQQPVQQQQLAPVPAAPEFDENAMRAKLAQLNYDESLSNVLIEQAKGNHAVALQQHQFMVNRAAEQDRYNKESQEFMRNSQQQLQNIQTQHQRELIDRDYSAFQSGLTAEVQKLVADPAAKGQIMQMANVVLAGLAANGQQLPPNGVAFKQAMYAVLGDKIHQAATAEVRQEVRTHQARATTRPSSAASKSSGKPGGLEGAGRFVEDFYKSIGIPTSGDNAVEV